MDIIVNMAYKLKENGEKKEKIENKLTRIDPLFDQELKEIKKRVKPNGSKQVSDREITSLIRINDTISPNSKNKLSKD